VPSLLPGHSHTVPYLLQGRSYTVPSLLPGHSHTVPSLLPGHSHTVPSLLPGQSLTLPNLLMYDLMVLAEHTRSRAHLFQAAGSLGLSLSRTQDPPSIQNPLDIRKGPQKESPLIHWAVLLQLVLASQIQPIQLSLSPAVLGSHWYFWAKTTPVTNHQVTVSTTLTIIV